MPRFSDDTDIRVPVELGPRSYEVRVVTGKPDEFGPFVRGALESSWSGRSCRSAFIVTDSNLEELGLGWQYRDALAQVGIEAPRLVVPPGEGSKCLASAESLYNQLVENKADRHTAIVALGGGVIGDLAGFVAATYARGIPLIMVPTTLLAQVDSSVGGKVGINHSKAKNIIGAFHQPAGVWIDTQTLKTLPDRELRCGLAEVVKYGVILDGDFFAELERLADDIMNRKPATLRRIVARCCQLKADVVSRDEREETGLRAVLNFGHTIGHAIESVARYGGVYQHGEAVSVGMVAESRLAQRLGWISSEPVDRLINLLDRFGLPTIKPGFDPGVLIDAMGRDKKNRDGRLHFVLPRAIGHVELTGIADEAEVRAVLEAL